MPSSDKTRESNWLATAVPGQLAAAVVAVTPLAEVTAPALPPVVIASRAFVSSIVSLTGSVGARYITG